MNLGQECKYILIRFQVGLEAHPWLTATRLSVKEIIGYDFKLNKNLPQLSSTQLIIFCEYYFGHVNIH